MGFISQFDLGRIIREYQVTHFFETGTWKGDAVAFALLFPFKKIYSAEIIPEIAGEAKARFITEPRVTIVEGKSIDALTAELPAINGNCIFWLDAHFPGADAGLVEYDFIKDEDIRLPLEQELAVIHRLRKDFRDVIIIDDLRVYEDGDFENGAAPSDTLPTKNRNLDFIGLLFGDSHFALKSYKSEGYLLLFPKDVYGLSRDDPDDFFAR
ncbi:MAG: hypothetical protein IPO53_10585 [Chitinophagaceae bacterium]|nr:hypothetical protein [Chitinophagaceae bacterium]